VLRRCVDGVRAGTHQTRQLSVKPVSLNNKEEIIMGTFKVIPKEIKEQILSRIKDEGVLLLHKPLKTTE